VLVLLARCHYRPRRTYTPLFVLHTSTRTLASTSRCAPTRSSLTFSTQPRRPLTLLCASTFRQVSASVSSDPRIKRWWTKNNDYREQGQSGHEARPDLILPR